MLDETMVCSKCGGDIDYTAYEPLVKILEEREEAKRAERERVKAEKAAQREKAKHERAASRERKRAERDERKALAEREKRRDLVETRASPVAIQRDQPIAVVQPPLEHGHAAGVPSINVHIPKRASSMGIASLVLAIVALAFSWIPFVGVLAIPLSVLALVLALAGLLVALTRRGSGIGYPIAGGLTAALALSISTSMTWAINDAITSVASGGRHEREAARAAAHWTPASKPIVRGDVEVLVKSVSYGTIELEKYSGSETSKSSETYLRIAVRVKNISQTRKLDHSSWSEKSFGLDSYEGSIRDNYGNKYDPIGFSAFSGRPKGHMIAEALYPDNSVEDILIFEPPIPDIKFLHLELPARNFGGKGTLWFEIPATMIRGVGAKSRSKPS